MSVSTTGLRQASVRSSKSKKPVSLSTYFPPGTQYFYGYPAGEDSGFVNKVPPVVEELVAERVMSCAGDHVSVVRFAATSPLVLGKDLVEEFSIPQLHARQLTLLPQEIGPNLRGTNRDHAIKDALLHSVKDGSLVMAQPYNGKIMDEIYQIPAKLINYLNDKNSMGQFIAQEFLPKRLATYSNGVEFAQNYKKLTLPYVAKASASSSGDGVYICLTVEDARAAAAELKEVPNTILVEEHVVAIKNYAVHFGVPYDQNMPIDLLGVSEQLTTDEGDFIGAMIRSTTPPNDLTEVTSYLKSKILQKVRDMGWYGVGCFDVLVDALGKCYFIDCNFRMTATCAYHFLVANGTIKAPLISFGGELSGSRTDLEACLLPVAGRDSTDKFMQLIALSRHGDCWRFNASLSFDDHEQLQKRAKQLLEFGVSSKALEQLT